MDAEVVSGSIKLKADEIAMGHFLQQFASEANAHWSFLRYYALNSKEKPCLDLAMRACGMAALDNVKAVPKGRCYARSLYTKALGLLHAALEDPQKSRTDESLITVTVLGYYEVRRPPSFRPVCTLQLKRRS